MKANFPLLSFRNLFTLTLLILAFYESKAQINIQQNFNSSTGIPSGWSTSPSNGFEFTSASSCNGNSARDLIYGTGTNAYLATPNQSSASNGTDVTVSFLYKVINYSGLGATPNGWGSIDVQYSLNNGSTWTSGFTINSSNHTPSTSCTAKSFVIAGTSVPNGSSFKLRFNNNWTTGQFYVYLDNISITQNTTSPPDCNANLTSPLNGAANVPVSQNQITWNSATGLPSGYRLTIGTTSGGNNIANNIDVGNVNSYSFNFQYQTTYYIQIVPYNANGAATGCTMQSFSTETPVTTTVPWNQGFDTTATPVGWNKNSFVIGSTVRLPDAESNVIYKNLRSTIPTENFSTISVGEIQNGNELNFNYRFADFNSPYSPPAAGAGAFTVSVSTDYGINYSTIQTVNSDGSAGWKNFVYDLSTYEGEFVKIKITANWVSGNWVLGFDDFYIGQTITCETPNDLILEYAGANDAGISWTGPSNSAGYNWFLFQSGSNPDTDSPYSSGTTTENSVQIMSLPSATEFDFYVQTDCGADDGNSNLSDAFTFSTVCSIINSYPFTETFEDNSTNLDCWSNEFENGIVEWSTFSGAAEGTINAAHSGSQNAIFYYNSPSAAVSKLVSPPFNLSNLSTPTLQFWYANEAGNGQNEMRVYYKNSSSANWQLIPDAVYNTSVNEWTEVSLELPNISDEYYIAFQGTNHWGNGIVLDDVKIYDADSCPETTIWNGSSWTNGIPDANKQTIIDGNLVVNQNLESCGFEITENGNVEINSGVTLTVHQQIINHAGPQNFVLNSGGNIIQTGALENLGEITIQRDSQPFKRLDYTLWSSPVAEQQIQSFSPNTLPNRIYTYEGENQYQVVSDVTSDFESAKGYLFRAPNNWSADIPEIYTGTFTGIPHNGNFSIATYPDNYTSIGNPYPSNIDADLLFDTNPGLSAVYFWTNTNPFTDGEYSGNNYATYTFAGGVGTSGPEGNETETPNGIIATGQGFIVKTSTNSVNFNNNIRTSNNTEFFKNTTIERHRFWLNFMNGSNNSLDQILISYMEGATNGFDNQIDGLLFGYEGSSLYSYLDNQKLVIQGRALPFDDFDVVTLGIKIINSGNYKISISASDGLFSEGQQIYILDKYENQIFNLTEGTFEFYSETGEFNDRFDIIYRDSTSNCPEFTNWNGLAWNNGIPDGNKKTIINGELATTQDLEVCDLEIAPNGKITISNGTNLLVNGKVINHSDENGLIVENNANLIQTEEFTAPNEGAATITKNSQPMVRLDYTFWSSPVSGQELQHFSPETLPNRIYTYEGENNYIEVPNVETDFSSAKGYLFRAPNNFDSTNPVVYQGNFIGVPANGNYSVPTYAGNFTSVGNPYPSNLNADGLMTENTGISAFYFWVNSPLIDGEYTGNNYATYNLAGGTSNTGETQPGESGVPNGIISKGQGFIVKTADAQLNFNNSMRTTENTDFFRTNDLEKHRFWLNLKDENGLGMNQILIGYIENATNGFDAQMDASFFGYEGSAIYSWIENQTFTIQSRALPFDVNDLIPLGFKAIHFGKFSISIVHSDGLFAEGQTIYLKDNLLGILHNLSESDYEFESEEGTFNSRFEILYKEEQTMSNSDFASNEIQIYKNGGFIEIKSPENKISGIEIFDLSGRKLFTKENLNQNFYQINGKQFGIQILVIKVKTKNDLITTKKLIP